MALDGITLRSLVHEMKSKLVNGKIDKITQPEKDEIWLTIRNEKQNHKLLISANSSTPRIHFVNDAKKELSRRLVRWN